MRVVDHTGKVFGRLTVLGMAESESAHKKWRCQCSCGSVVTVRGTSLTQGDTVSCGCQKRERGASMMKKHGLYYHSAYQSWLNMLDRCENTESDDYPEYGGRGIKVCERWHDVANFVEDMGERPDGMTLDRKDVNGHYEPSNCRWATATMQANNRRSNVHVIFGGAKMTLTDCARAAGVDYKRLFYLVRTKGDSIEDAIAALK